MATFLVLSTAGFVAFIVYTRTQPRIEAAKQDANTSQTPYLSELASKLAALEVKVEGLPSLWEEERDRAKKHADRAQAAYRGAESILAAVDGGEDDEGEDHPLYEDDEAGGRDQQMLALHPRMGLPPSDDETELRNRAKAAIQTLAGMGR